MELQKSEDDRKSIDRQLIIPSSVLPLFLVSNLTKHFLYIILIYLFTVLSPLWAWMFITDITIYNSFFISNSECNVWHIIMA